MTKMSTKKKTIIAISALLGIVVIVLTSVFATVAYLTSSAAVSNVFTIGKVGITLTESKVNPDGTLTDGGATQVDSNTYHLVPNKTYTKDPRITVADGSEDSYLFALVRNDLEKLEDTTDAVGKPTIAQQLEKNGWAKYTTASTGWVYVYVGEGNVPAGDAAQLPAGFVFGATAAMADPGTYKLFDTFSIAPDAVVDTYGAAKITITAVAIQNDGFADIDAAWAAVVETYPYIHTGSGS